jgi:hypothetical protein
MMRVFISMMIVACCSTLTGYAQSDSTKNKFNFKFGTYYNSKLNYYGRTDSLQSSGIFPMAELWLNKKFYINAAPVFTHNKAAGFQYAGTVATAGYVYNNGKSGGHIYVVKPIYKDNTQLVQSALKAQVVANFTWLNKIINITGGADVKFSDNTDYGITAGVDHIFKKQLPRNSVLAIDPSLYMYAGTQQFSKTHYEKINNFPLFPGTDQLVTENVKNFNILSYEFSVPVIYSKGKWILMAIPSYVIPQNLITVENRPDLSERGSKLFYITVGSKVSF